MKVRHWQGRTKKVKKKVESQSTGVGDESASGGDPTFNSFGVELSFVEIVWDFFFCRKKKAGFIDQQ